MPEKFLRDFDDAYVSAPCNIPVSFQVAKQSFYATSHLADALVPLLLPMAQFFASAFLLPQNAFF